MVNSCSSHKTVIVYDFQDITRNHTQYKLYYAALYRPVRLRQDLTAGVTSGARGWDELFIYFFTRWLKQRLPPLTQEAVFLMGGAHASV